ncbi:hypothetical protein SEA_RAHALELUJAH_37 [Mycobacterium phage Rahalelujah]|nr:hypothetical protein SEA_RAHALELUJAH_37 [Mycobacterium phage Rahalelujah]
MLTWIRRLFKRNWDRWPEFRPGQTITAENRSIWDPHGYADEDYYRRRDEWRQKEADWEEALLASGWTFSGFDAYGNKVWTKHCVPGSRP